ncbi:MAG: Kiwa anti-phage protein KwaB-like domain-containing protein [Ktedonobacteraceae bacterium]
MTETIVQHKVSPVETTDYKGVFNNILSIDLNSCTINVCVASVSKTEATPHFQRIKITEEVGVDFRGIIEDFIKKYRSEWNADELLFPEYAPQSDPDTYEIEHISLSAYNILLEQISPLLSLAGVEVFDEDKKFVADMRFYVIAIHPPQGDPVYFFRIYEAKKLLSQSKCLGIWLNNGSYDRITTPVFFFDEEIDCMSQSGIMFIFNKTNFQNIFQFFEAVRIVAREALDNIKINVPIQNFDEFARDCEGHITKMRKLKNIATKSYLSKITMDHIKEVIKRNNLPVKTVEENGKEMLVYDRKERWVILKLLDDDYLWSLLTEQCYEVTGKREL